jgi:hypothetical protein
VRRVLGVADDQRHVAHQPLGVQARDLGSILSISFGRNLPTKSWTAFVNMSF